MKQITSQQQLDAILSEHCDEFDNDLVDFFVLLSSGLRSTKYITFDDFNHDYYVFNEIDNTEEIIPHDHLMQSFPIGEAISKGALFQYDD